MLQGEHSAILSNFIKLPFVIKIFVLSIFEWPFYTGFTVLVNLASLLVLITLNLSFHRYFINSETSLESYHHSNWAFVLG